MRRWVLPKLGDMLFTAILLSALMLGQRMLNVDSDLGRHLVLGNYILNTGEIPTHDLLSFTRTGDARPPYEWLAQISFAMAQRSLDLDGVVLVSALTIAAVFWLVYQDSLRRSQAPLLSLGITMWAAFASSLHWLTRPHVFSFLLFSLWVLALERVRQGRGLRLWLAPALMIVWVNVHGGFVMGFLAWGAYAAGWLWDGLHHRAERAVGLKLLWVGIGSLVGSMITPDLWGNWKAVLQNHSAYLLARTVETMPTNIRMPGTWPFFGLLCLFALLLALRSAPVAASHVILLCGLAVVSMAIARNIPFFAIAAAPIIAASMRRVFAERGGWSGLEDAFSRIQAQALGGVWPTLSVLAAIAVLSYHLVTTGAPVFNFDPQRYPVAASNWLNRRGLQARMFNDFNWGGYLLFRSWPRQQVFIDSQSDFYGEDLTRQAALIAAGGPGWEAALQQDKVTWIISRRGMGLIEAAARSGWQIQYEDDVAVILSRR